MSLFQISLAVLLLAVDVAVSSEFLQTLELSPRLCFGASGNVYGEFRVPYDIELDSVNLTALPPTANAPGVRCNRWTAYTPFQCAESVSVGVVCTHSGKALLQGYNQRTLFSGTSVEQNVSISIDLHLEKDTLCQLVYLPNYYDMGYSERNGTSCVRLTAFISHHAFVLSSSAIHGRHLALWPAHGTSGWVRYGSVMWYAADVSDTSVSTVPHLEEEIMLRRDSPSPVTLSLSRSSLQQRSVFDPESGTLFFAIAASVPGGNILATLDRQCSQARPSATIPRHISSAEVSRLLVNGFVGPGVRTFVLYNGSGYYNVSSVDRLFLESIYELQQDGEWRRIVEGSIHVSSMEVVCQVPAGQSDVLVSSVAVRMNCPFLLTSTDCNSDGFCGWSFHSSMCCWKGTHSEATDRCYCGKAVSLSYVPNDHTAKCQVANSGYSINTLIQQACKEYELNMQTDCVAQYTRCRSETVGIEQLLNSAMAVQCISKGQCIDIAQASCSAFVIAPPASTSVPVSSLPSSTELNKADVSSNVSRMNVELVWDGTAVVKFSIVSKARVWNATALSSLAEVRSIFSVPQIVKFGFVPEVITQPAVLLNHYEMYIVFGPYEMHPQTWAQTIEINIPPTWFIMPTSSEGHPIQLEFFEDQPPENTRQFSHILSILGLAVSLIAPSGGWFGLVQTQTFLMQVNAECTPASVLSYFPFADVVVSPQVLISDSNRFLFASATIFCLVLLLVHLVPVLVYYKSVRSQSIYHSFNILWFPLPYLLCTCVLFHCLVLSAYRGVIDDRTPYVRVYFFLASLLFLCLFLLIWRLPMKKGIEGYYKLYDWGPRGEGLSKKVRWFFFSFFLPTGRWEQARGFSPVRVLFHEKGCTFGFIIHFFVFARCVLCAHISGATDYCYAKDVNAGVVEAVMLIVFVFMRPLRLPILNVLYVVCHIMQLAYIVAAADWTKEGAPSTRLGRHIGHVAVAVVFFQLVFGTAVGIFLATESIIRLLENRKREPGDRAGSGEQLDEAEANSLEEPMLEVPELSSGPAAGTPERRKITLPEYDPLPVAGGREEIVLSASGRVVQISPVPVDYDAGELLLLFQIFGAETCDLENRVALVTMKDHAAAVSAAVAFNGKYLYSDLMECTVIDVNPLKKSKQGVAKNPQH